MQVIIVNDYQEMSNQAGEFFAAQIEKNPNLVLGLATGSTPLGLYDYLAKANQAGSISFAGVTTFNLDEYLGMPPTHEQSYRYFMDANLFDKTNINKQNTFVPNGAAKDPKAECARYSLLLTNTTRDIQLLGLGNNGHIGFNEPGTPFDSTTQIIDLQQNTIDANARFFTSANEVPKQAITMGIKEIMDAKCVVMLVSGANKADALARLVNGTVDPESPGSILQTHPNFIIFADQAAGAKLQ